MKKKLPIKLYSIPDIGESWGQSRSNAHKLFHLDRIVPGPDFFTNGSNGTREFLWKDLPQKPPKLKVGRKN